MFDSTNVCNCEVIYMHCDLLTLPFSDRASITRQKESKFIHSNVENVSLYKNPEISLFITFAV